MKQTAFVYTLTVGVELQAPWQVFHVYVDLLAHVADHPRTQFLQPEPLTKCTCTCVVNCPGFTMQITSSLTLMAMKDRCAFQFVLIGSSLSSQVLICPFFPGLHIVSSFLTAGPGPWQPHGQHQPQKQIVYTCFSSTFRTCIKFNPNHKSLFYIIHGSFFSQNEL